MDENIYVLLTHINIKTPSNNFNFLPELTLLLVITNLFSVMLTFILLEQC